MKCFGFKFKEELKKDLDKQKCPNCDSKNIGIDNWGMFEDEEDWFYYCKECDGTFTNSVK